MTDYDAVLGEKRGIEDAIRQMEQEFKIAEDKRQSGVNEESKSVLEERDTDSYHSQRSDLAENRNQVAEESPRQEMNRILTSKGDNQMAEYERRQLEHRYRSGRKKH